MEKTGGFSASDDPGVFKSAKFAGVGPTSKSAVLYHAAQRVDEYVLIYELINPINYIGFMRIIQMVAAVNRVIFIGIAVR